MKRTLILLHRWLGIAGNLLFVVWFASALVMMYARMPALDPGDRLDRLPPLDLDSVRVGPARAAGTAGLDAGDLSAVRVRLGMAGDRPVYRFRTAAGWTSVYADTGNPLLQVSEREALGIASSWVAGNNPSAPPTEASLTYDGYLTRPDQWSLQIRSLLPLHQVRAGNEVLYVSDRTAEVVMATTPGSRFWGAAGAVFHWLYFTPLRTHSTFWSQLIVWTASLGCVLTLSGLVVGLLRLRRKRSPYRGVMRWHHYSGLAFGATAFTWVLSGALSMDPFGWQAGRTTSPAGQAAVAGGAVPLHRLELDSIRTAAGSIAESFPPREVELLQFAGEPLVLAYRAPGDGRSHGGSYASSPLGFLSAVQPFEHRLVSLEDGTPRRFGQPSCWRPRPRHSRSRTSSTPWNYRNTTPTTKIAGIAAGHCPSCGSASTTRPAPGSISTRHWAASSTARTGRVGSTAGSTGACTGSTSPASTTGAPCGTSS